jgi:hypothetical protein
MNKQENAIRQSQQASKVWRNGGKERAEERTVKLMVEEYWKLEMDK